MANSADHDETARNEEPSHLDLLFAGICIVLELSKHVSV